MDFTNYQVGDFYDEAFQPGAKPRPEAQMLLKTLEPMPPDEYAQHQQAAETMLLNSGITFNVYSDEQATERIFPFDMFPRMIRAEEWDQIEQGLKQRIYALNCFLNDIYHDKKILKDGVIPEDVIYSGQMYRKECEGLEPPAGIWMHITGSDLVRDKDGTIYVLEDNLRCPSGVSYVLENREVMKRIFPSVFKGLGVRPVADFPDKMLSTLLHSVPQGIHEPTAVVLTPGSFNSAYFEHSFLAQVMGIPLVEGSDLVIENGFVMMRTTKGLERVDVIYRRIDDDFLDPLVFREDSMLGVPGIMEAYRNGCVALANAPGTGIADDKVVYAYVPDMIKYYMQEDAIIPNVPTYLCWRDEDKQYVLDNMEKLVVKAANEAGGYGLLVGPQSTKEQRKEFADNVRNNPRGYIAQPTLSLSRMPTLIEDHFEGRHLDLRPYTLYGEEIYVMPGGLTRVALKKGSLVVNSSQGGGSKDTWVLSPGKEEVRA